MSIRNVAPALWFPVVLVLLVIYLGWAMKGMANEREVARYADDPVMLYQTVGIKECEYSARHKIEKTSAVLISDDDLVRVKPLVQEHFKGEITAALYTNAPEATKDMRGQPALIPLRKEKGTYCALGIAGSYSTPLFLELEAKYQNQLK